MEQNIDDLSNTILRSQSSMNKWFWGKKFEAPYVLCLFVVLHNVTKNIYQCSY